LEQAAVPVDWPKRVGYPPPGVIRKTEYPAGEGKVLKGLMRLKRAHKKRRKKKHHTEAKGGPGFPTHDDEYPCTPEGKKIAKAHAWQFPSKRIKVCGKILKY
jgi:hypothetical protein